MKQNATNASSLELKTFRIDASATHDTAPSTVPVCARVVMAHWLRCARCGIFVYVQITLDHIFLSTCVARCGVLCNFVSHFM